MQPNDAYRSPPSGGTIRSPPSGRTIRENKTVNDVFSGYVARLGPRGEPPDVAYYRKVREGLRSVLLTEMRRRGLWRSPPSFLGLSGADWGGGALDELVSDAYTFIFIRRLRGLRDQQRLKGNIRPMVILNARNFLTELQAKADPLGYRVFGRLRKAVEGAVERGEVFVLNLRENQTKKQRLGNGSLLGFRPGLATVTPRAALEEPARRWNDDLLPELITAEGRAVPAVVERLAAKVLALEAEGVAALRLGDLVAALKDDARGRWHGVWRGTFDLAMEPGAGGEPVPVQVARPDEEPDWPRRLVLIQDCVAASIGRRRRAKDRRDLWSLWTLIRVTRLLPGEDGRLPSFTELGRQLELTRDRVRQLFRRLKPLVLACLRAGAVTGDSNNHQTAPRRGPRRARSDRGRGDRS